MTIIELVILVIFGISFIVQMAYYWLVYGKLAFHKQSNAIQEQKPPVSIVIAARNEYHNLIKSLPLILEQDYPDFEVVVVNHASNDETELYLKELQQKDNRLKAVQIDRELNFFTGKKFPLSLGIKSAKNEILLLTDADCTPNSSNWITAMIGSYANETEIVLGYGPYKTEKGFVNKLVRYDTFLVAMQYLSFALIGIPYMGVGRNLSYKRSTFFKNKGFTSHYKIISGDDDLFINQIAKKNNTKISIDPDGFMFSKSKENFKSWVKQKHRHLSTGVMYTTGIKILLGGYSISQFLFFVGFVTLLIFQVFPIYILSAFALRIISQAIIYRKVLKNLEERKLFVSSLLLELLHMLIILTISLTSVLRKPSKWK